MVSLLLYGFHHFALVFGKLAHRKGVVQSLQIEQGYNSQWEPVSSPSWVVPYYLAKVERSDGSSSGDLPQSEEAKDYHTSPEFAQIFCFTCRHFVSANLTKPRKPDPVALTGSFKPQGLRP